MSLRAFHVAFIVASIVLSLVVTAWGVREFLNEGSTSALVIGIAALGSGIAMVIYGARFFRKLQELA
ncbi:MAG: hypothetical protein OES32_18205 [Acidobacteriota bacterium]|nr:hypothetical protein [Acidobacteriota bacterium]MDH3525511.1 hypothetical protein [Acidobacteriota bacterium]